MSSSTTNTMHFPLLSFWVLFHIALIGTALLGWPWKINADIYSVLPASHALQDVGKAEQVWSKENSSLFNILIGHSKFAEAKAVAVLFYDAFNADSALESLELYVDSATLGNFREHSFRHRYHLQSREWVRSLDSGNVESIRSNALGIVYGAFSISSLENLELDPFLLGETGIANILNSPLLSNMSLDIREDVRAAQDSGCYFILLSGKLAPSVSSFAKDGHAIGRIYDTADSLSKQIPGVRFAFSGVPFHSYESSKNAQKEVTIITTLSLLAIIFLLLFAFRSPVPILATVAAIALSALFATAATLLVFKEIHVFTFVFGTSLIGVGIDYSLHFFVHWKSGLKNKDGFAVRSKIIACVALGFLTTQLGYAALMCAPFPLLRQMAFFSFAGLLSAFLSILIVFPLLPLPAPKKRHLSLRFARFLLVPYTRFFTLKQSVRLVIFALLLLVLLPGLFLIRFENDIRSLYRMSESLKQSEILANRVLNYGSSGWFYIIAGKTPEETLQKEEFLCNRLDSLGVVYLATSSFVPSLQTQRHTYSVIEKKLMPAMPEQLSLLGFGENSLEPLNNNFNKAKNDFITVNDSLPSALHSIIDRLWIGEVEGMVYSIVLPLHTREEAPYRAIASPLESIYFVDKVGDIGEELTALSRIALALVLLVYGIMLGVLTVLYGFRTAAGILLAPFFACAASISVIGILGLPFNFFAMAGIVLTLAIGIDYSLFFARSTSDRRVTMLAVLLSMTTTMLSFGTLSFSSFAPVSLFGLVVFLGIGVCFLLSPLQSSDRRE